MAPSAPESSTVRIRDFTLELAFGVRADRRGVGALLIEALLNRVRSQGIAGVSLSVEKENYAVRLF